VVSFADLSYRSDVVLRMARYVRENTSPQNKVYWVGEWLTLGPEYPNAEESPEFRKEFYYFFNANSNSLSYYTDRRGFTLYPFPPVQNVIEKPERGDLIFYNPNRTSAGSGASFTEPIRVYAFDQYQLYERDGSLPLTFVDAAGGNRISIRRVEGGLGLT